MHRISRAVLAVSAIALASAPTAAAAEDKSTKPRIAVIEFKAPAGGASSAPLEVVSFAWGDENAAGPMKPVFVKSWSTSGDADAPAHRGGGSNQMSLDDTAGKEKAAAPAAVSHDLRTNVIARTAPPPGSAGDPDRPIVAGSVPNPSPASVGASKSITIGGARTETASGQATGKRQHMPIRARSTYEQPRGKGSVWIRVATPWSACRVGARYPSLRLAEGARAYTLEDVTVASCGAGDADDRPTEEVAFYYNKVTVRLGPEEGRIAPP